MSYENKRVAGVCKANIPFHISTTPKTTFQVAKTPLLGGCNILSASIIAGSTVALARREDFWTLSPALQNASEIWMSTIPTSILEHFKYMPTSMILGLLSLAVFLFSGSLVAYLKEDKPSAKLSWVRIISFSCLSLYLRVTVEELCLVIMPLVISLDMVLSLVMAG